MASKMNRTMAGLLTRDLILHHLPDLARNGVAIPPDLVLDFIDGASRTAARALLKVGMSTPEIRKAANDPAHPDHRMVGLLKDYATYFAAEHPTLENGDPAPWRENYSIGMKARVVDGRPFDAAYEISPNEAKTYAEYVGARGDLQAIRHDSSHPDHGTVTADFTKLMERAAAPPEPAVDNSDQQQRGVEGNANAQPPAADARQQINALLADADFKGRYFDTRQPGHAEAVEQMRALHEALAGSGSSAAPVSNDPLAATQARIVEINSALRQYRIGAADKAILLDELHDLNVSLPAGTKPAQAPAANIRPDTARPVGVVASGVVSRPAAIALTEKLKTAGLRGQARLDVLNELAAELAGGPVGPRDGGQAA